MTALQRKSSVLITSLQRRGWNQQSRHLQQGQFSCQNSFTITSSAFHNRNWSENTYTASSSYFLRCTLWYLKTTAGLSPSKFTSTWFLFKFAISANRIFLFLESYGHVQRRDIKGKLQIELPGRRATGRPKMRFRSIVREDRQEDEEWRGSSRKMTDYDAPWREKQGGTRTSWP